MSSYDKSESELLYLAFTTHSILIMKHTLEPSSTTSITYIGIDVSKKTLDIFFPLNNSSSTSSKKAQGKAKSFPNHLQGWNKLLIWTAQLNQNTNHNLHFVCEATGGYERPFIHHLLSLKQRASIVMPQRVRHHAKAQGQLAKTDAIDAQLIADFAQHTHPQPASLTSSTQQELTTLLDYRNQLNSQLKVIKAQQEHYPHQPDHILRATSDRLINTLTQEIKHLDQTIDTLIAKDTTLHTHYQRFIQVQGIGRITAIAALAYLPEIGTLNRKEAAAIAGLAPYNNDSGFKKGKRSIRGGRAKLRTAFYMAALTASRQNPILRDIYQTLKAKGKPSKVALTAIMRKLIILLNHIAKNPNFQLAQ